MQRKWKLRFLISLTINLLLMVGTGYIILVNTLSSGHNYDNMLIISEDLENISVALQKGANTIEEFDRELQKTDTGHWTDKENQLIKLQIVHLLFDDQDHFKSIETYSLKRENEE